MLKLSWIITAGGVGKRMGAGLPKQFLLLEGQPLLMHTIRQINHLSPNNQIIVTLPAEQLSVWDELCKQHAFEVEHAAIAGGEERYHSVKGALSHCTGTHVAVHDGVRPFVTAATLEALLAVFPEHQAAVPVVPITDSLRKINDGGSEAVIRSEYVSVQTPQIVEIKLLKRAYEQVYHAGVTDDACLVEALGEQVVLVKGNDDNIKITTPLDYQLAEIVLGKRNLSTL